MTLHKPKIIKKLSKLIQRGIWRSKEKKVQGEAIVERDELIISPLCPLDTFSNVQEMCSSSMVDCKIMSAYRSNDPTFGIVVIKIALLGEETKKELKNEVSLMSQCRHPNIICLYNCYTFQNSIWMEMEYCSHGKLTDLFQSGILLNEAQIASITKEILQGLDYLHDKLIIHNDIKSDNILLGKDYSIKISDLGLSKKLRSRGQMRHRSVGTPYWMAPEQIGVCASYGLSADIWSLGILILEMTNDGIPPHFDLSVGDALVNILKQPAPKLESVYSHPFQDFMSRILVKDPSGRASVKDLLHHQFITRHAVEHPSKFIPELLASTKPL